MATHKKKAKEIGAKIGFLDETGISERPTVRRTWAPKGQTPIIQSCGSWKKRSVIGMISCSPSATDRQLFLRIFKKSSVNSTDVIRFLKELRRHIKGKLILVLDRLPAHRSNKLMEFIDSQKHWLMIEYLPPYAPELNPVEYVWSSAKLKDWANLYLESIDDVDNHIRKSGRRMRRNQKLLTGFLKASKLFKRELST